MRARQTVGIALGALALFATRPASAEPQVAVGLTGGYAQHRLKDDADGAGHLGLHGDLLLFRKRTSDGAFGPYAEALTVAFSDLQVGAGATFLVPGSSTFSLALSAGGYARLSELGARPGAAGRIFFGFRGYNFDRVYGMANGLFVQGRMGIGETRQAEVLFGLQVDLAVLGLPFLLLYGSLR